MSRERDSVVSTLAALCKEMDIKCLVQVGAEDGYEADYVQKATGCRAVCIDADPKCCRCSTGIEYHRCMIGATDEVKDFYVHEISGLSSALTRNDGNEMHIAVEQYRLDTFCATLGINPDALIIDTEGTTMAVLEGAGDVLDKVRLIYAEVQLSLIRPGVSLFPEVNEFLLAHGFVRRDGWPAYDAVTQGNVTWVRP